MSVTVSQHVGIVKLAEVEQLGTHHFHYSVVQTSAQQAHGRLTVQLGNRCLEVVR